jgi:hypothetical protein
MPEYIGPDIDISITPPPPPPPARQAGRTGRWHVPAFDEPMVYFIGIEKRIVPNSPVKIGVSRHPLARVAEMSLQSPYPLTLLAICRGGLSKERKYHARFAAQRLHGEWFARSPDLERLIRWQKAHGDLRALLLECA